MIGRKDFEDGNFLILNGGKKAIFDFLKSNPNNAYTKQEIAKETGLTVKTIQSQLTALKKMGFLEGKKPYYIIKPEMVKKDVREVISTPTASVKKISPPANNKL